MRFAWLFLLSTAAFAQAPSVRGYREVESVLGQRMLDEGRTFSFATLCLQSEDPNSNPTALLQLLGAYQSAGNDEFLGADPNAVSMLLWPALLESAGRELLRNYASDGAPPLPLNPYFRASFEPLLRWPSPEVRNEATLRAFWMAIVSYDAPESELDAFVDFALHSSLASEPATAAVPKLFLLATFNPHFLLRK